MNSIVPIDVQSQKIQMEENLPADEYLMVLQSLRAASHILPLISYRRLATARARKK